MPIPTLTSSHRSKFSIDSSHVGASYQNEINARQDDITTDIPNLTQQSHGGNLKRRSLLPQPGQSKYTSRVAETTQLDKISQDTVPGRPRPRSMYQPNPTIPAPLKGESDNVSRMAPPTKSIAKPSTTSTGLGRSQSLKKPSTSTQPAQPSGVASHSRTKSSGTAILQHSRLASQSSIASGATSSNISSTHAPPATRTSARLAGLSRTASLRTKTEREKTLQAPRPVPKTEAHDDPHPRRKEIPKTTVAPARPAFTTLQQHFTPRKVGKAPTSTFLQPVAVPSSDTLPPELLNVQSELLQLHLLHSSAASMEQQWKQSAKHHLSKKFDEVTNLYALMLQYERTGQEQKNLQALFEWSDGKQTSLIEYIQLLSGPLHDLPTFVEPDGRYQRLVAAFEQWMTHKLEDRSARSAPSTQHLDEQWKSEVAAISRKVTTYARDLGELQQPAKGSSIASMLEACKGLVDGMLEELKTMQGIVEHIEAEEKTLVEGHLQSIAQEFGARLVDAGSERAAWQM